MRGGEEHGEAQGGEGQREREGHWGRGRRNGKGAREGVGQGSRTLLKGCGEQGAKKEPAF